MGLHLRSLGLGKAHRVFFLALVALTQAGLKCNLNQIAPSPLGPSAGLPEYQELAVVALPGGKLNTAGGNLIVERQDLSIDTRLGLFSVGAVYNSATGIWLWNFNVTYDGTLFNDQTGATYTVPATNGAVIPGTYWVKVDNDQIKTKGGFIHKFGSGGRLQHIRWASSAYPRIEFLADGSGRQGTIQQCRAPSTCVDFFTIAYGTTGGAAGQVTQINDVRGSRTAQFDYFADGKLRWAKDGLDFAKAWPGFRYEYAASNGRLSKITNSEGDEIHYSFDAGNRLTSVQPYDEDLAAGIQPIEPYLISYKADSWDGSLYTTKVADPVLAPQGLQLTFQYDAYRRLKSFVNGALEATLFVPVAGGLRVGQVQHPDGTAVDLEYTAGEDVSNAKLRRSDGVVFNTINLTYEPSTSAVDRDRPRSRPIDRVYDDLGTILDRNYDAFFRLSEVKNGANETATFEYDSDQMISRVTDPAGGVTELLSYGEHGKPTQIVVTWTDPEEPTTFEFTYDNVGNPLKGVDGALDASILTGGVVDRAFDEDRNITSVRVVDQISSGNNSWNRMSNIDITHRSDHRRARITRPYGGQTDFVYDAFGRITELREKSTITGQFEGSSATRITTFTYDDLGRITEMLRPNGMKEKLSYDGAGRPNHRWIYRDNGGILDNEAVITYEHGRLKSIRDKAHDAGLALEEVYAYDDAGRIGTITYPGGEQLIVNHDDRSRPTFASLRMSSTQNSFRWFNFGYDGADRMKRLQDNNKTLLDYTFTAGRLTSILYGNGLTRTLGYHPTTGLPNATATTDSSGNVEDTSTIIAPGCLGGMHTTGKIGRGVTSTNLVESLFVSAGMNTWNGEPINGGPRAMFDLAALGGSYQYQYDELSNVTTWDDAACDLDFEYNPEHNRLLAVKCDSAVRHNFSYDGAGFVTSRDGVPLTYDGAGRVTSIAFGVPGQFVWDTFGRPVESRTNGILTRRRFGGLVEADANGNPTAIDLVEVRIENVTAGTPTRFYRHFDHRGNVRFVTDDSALPNVAAYYRYATYGLDVVTGDPGDVNRNMNFAMGRQYLPALTLLGGRLLDSETGRFLAPDPLFNLINQHAYTIGNPVFFWDPNGQRGNLVSVAAGAFVGGAIGGAISGPAAPIGAALGGLIGVAVAEMVNQVMDPNLSSPASRGVTPLNAAAAGLAGWAGRRVITGGEVGIAIGPGIAFGGLPVAGPADNASEGPPGSDGYPYVYYGDALANGGSALVFTHLSWGSCYGGHSGAGFTWSWGAPVGAVAMGIPDSMRLLSIFGTIALAIALRTLQERRRESSGPSS